MKKVRSSPAVSPDTRIGKNAGALLWNMFSAAKNRLASGLGTERRILDRLAHKGNKSVQERVAENTSTGSETLHWLAQHEENAVRAAVAQNGTAQAATAILLSGDTSGDVRYAMAESPWTSASLLVLLALDENPYVQDRARRTLDRVVGESLYYSSTKRINLPGKTSFPQCTDQHSSM